MRTTRRGLLKLVAAVPAAGIVAALISRPKSQPVPARRYRLSFSERAPYLGWESAIQQMIVERRR